MPQQARRPAIELRKTVIEELALIVQLERAADARDFVTGQALEVHRRNLTSADLRYLTIVDEGAVAGFLILKLEADGTSVEFRRIVTVQKDAGVGQRAIVAMEEHCRTVLRRSRVWLDVFEFNERARHIYEKLGYQCFSEEQRNQPGAPDGVLRVLFYEKWLTH